MICSAIDVLYSNVDWVTWMFDDEKDDETDDVDRTDCESYCFCVGGEPHRPGWFPVPSICFADDDDDDDVYSDSYYYWYCAESLFRGHLGTWIDVDEGHHHHSGGIHESWTGCAAHQILLQQQPPRLPLPQWLRIYS